MRISHFIGLLNEIQSQWGDLIIVREEDRESWESVLLTQEDISVIPAKAHFYKNIPDIEDEEYVLDLEL